MHSTGWIARVRVAVLLTCLVFGCPRRLSDAELERWTASRLERFSSASDFEAWRAAMRGANGGLFFGCLQDPGGAEGSAPGDSITNVQEAGVDEGGLVKVVGDHLVSLHRGRLASARVRRNGEDVLEAGEARAAPPDGFTQGTWYDELVVVGRRVLVVGFSYERMAAELVLYDLDAEGAFTHVGTWLVDGSDYYSWTNYAARAVNDQVLVYVPSGAWQVKLPTMRRWIRDNEFGEATPLVAPEDIFRPLQRAGYAAIHTLLTCDISGAEGITCDATSFAAAGWATMYVTPEHAFFWVPDEFDRVAEDGASAMAYRVELSTGDLAVARGRGTLATQLLLDANGDGGLRGVTSVDTSATPFGATRSAPMLVRMPAQAFSSDAWPRELEHAAIPLDVPAEGQFLNAGRWIGNSVVFSYVDVAGTTPDAARAVHVIGPDGVEHRLATGHVVERIEAVGSDAIAIGAGDSGLGFTTIRLEGTSEVAFAFTLDDSVQTDWRSHAFFFKAGADGGGSLALPSVNVDPQDFSTTSARLTFLSVGADLSLVERGALAAPTASVGGPECEVSCMDWYGNTRPIFLGDRTLGLFGNLVIEARLGADGMEETRRVVIDGPK